MNSEYTVLISVIMPVYNNELYIRSAIDSVLSQTFQNFEFIIIDNGSTDETLNIIQEYKDNRIKLISNNLNKGLIFSLNIGLKSATGKYIARMDSDDIMLSDRLEKQFRFMENNTDVFLLGGAHRILGTDNIVFHPKYDNEIRLRLLNKSAFTHPTVMMRRSVLREYNLFYKETDVSAEDYGLWVEVALLNLKMANLDDVLIEYRVHTTQISQTKFQEQLETSNLIRLHYLQEIFGSVFNNEELEILKEKNKLESLATLVLLPILSKLYYVNNQIAFFDKVLLMPYIRRIVFANLEFHGGIRKKDFFKIMFMRIPSRIKLLIFKYFLKHSI